MYIFKKINCFVISIQIWRKTLPQCAEGFIIVDICGAKSSNHGCSGVSTW